jgi:hypothetical protein
VTAISATPQYPFVLQEVMYINHEMELLCNVAREQVIGKIDFEVFPRKIASKIAIDQCFASAPFNLYIRPEKNVERSQRQGYSEPENSK